MSSTVSFAPSATSTATTTLSPDNWLDWFIFRESFDVINKAHFQKLSETFNHQLWWVSFDA